MTEQRFEQLVRDLEGFSKAHPTRYKLNVALLAFGGYAYVLAVLSTVIALIIGCFFLISNGSSGNALLFKAGLGLIVLATMIVRALWVRLDPPSGLELERANAPRLFLIIDKIRKALGTPPFHHVLIVNDLNAAVVQIPRLGIFGWQRNYLLLGLPLLLTFTPAQFRAVLAHEFGHLGRQHGRFFTWIYRTRMTWGRLLEELTKRNHWASGIFTKFLGWYAPFFNAYSFVLARAQEYEADRNAAALVGPHGMKDTLASLAVINRLLQESFWPDLDRRSKDEDRPPVDYLHALARTLRTSDAQDRHQAFFGQALHERTGYADTHPSLQDRLAALETLPGKTARADASFPRLLGEGEDSAARYYLGSTSDELCELLNREWAEQAAEVWKQKHQEKQAAYAQLLELQNKAAAGSLTDDELWDYAAKTELFDGGEAALPLLRQLLDQSPDHAAANYALGRLLLAQGDRSGVERLDRAVVKDPEAFLAAAALAEEFFTRTGQLQEAETYRRRAMERRDLIAEAEEEWRQVSPEDQFLPHDLAKNTAAKLADDLSMLPEIGEAYLARKAVKIMPELPAYVLLVVPKYRWYEWREDVKNDALLARLTHEVALPPSTYVLVLGSQVKRRWRKKALNRLTALPLAPRSSQRTAIQNRGADDSGSNSVLLPWLTSRWVQGAIVVSVLTLLVSIGVHPSPNCFQAAEIKAKPPVDGTIYFIPIGEFPASQFAAVTARYAGAWHLPVRRLPSLPLDDSLWDRTRHQLVAERVIAKMQRDYAEQAAAPHAVLIGLTAQDMYRQQSSWRYAFSHREGGRYAVVSSARMHPRTLPLHLPHGSLFAWDLRDEELAVCRLTKMVGKNVGVLYYRLAMTDDPTSLLYNDIGGPSDLDVIEERF